MLGVLQQKKEGWLAVRLLPDRVDVARVVRIPGAKPRVSLLESYEQRGDALVVLGKTKPFRQARCTTLLEPGNYQLNQFDAPEVPESELKEALRWKLKDVVDYPVDRCALDLLRIPVPNLAGRPQPVWVASAASEVVAGCLAEFGRGRIDLQAIDIPEMALRNVASLMEDDNRGLAFLSFDATGGTLICTYSGELYLSRRFEITSDQLTSEDSDRRAACFDRVGLDLQRSLDNFERMYNFISVSKVVLGPGTISQALAAFLRDYVYVPVEVLDLTAAMDCVEVPDLRDLDIQAGRLLVIGAALRAPEAAA